MGCAGYKSALKGCPHAAAKLFFLFILVAGNNKAATAYRLFLFACIMFFCAFRREATLSPFPESSIICTQGS